MTDYFAHDDALESGLAFLCEVFGTSPDIGGKLESGFSTFLGMAQKYEKYRSSLDKDCVSPRFSTKNTLRSTRKNQPARSRYPLCFDFLASGGCQRSNCSFAHECAMCRSRDHGKSRCQDR